MGQYHNLIAELYQEDQPVFRNFMQINPKVFTEIERHLTPDLQTAPEPRLEVNYYIELHGGVVDHKLPQP